jgi:dTMP kinase
MFMADKLKEWEKWQPLKINWQSHTYPGKLIVFDGIDGSGKTSLIDYFSKFLDQKGISNIKTKTPTDDVRNMWSWRAWSDGSYGVDRKDIHGFGLSVIAFGDRLVHQKRVVEKHLNAGTWVLCDRYLLTSLAYESSPIHEELASLLIRPDLGIIVDVDPNEAFKRVRKRDNEDEHPADTVEKPQLRNRYITLADINDYIVANTTNTSVEKTFESIQSNIDQLIKG